MRATWSHFTFFFLLTVAICGCSAAEPRDSRGKPAELPSSYRDFKVYTTSAPDPQNDSHIVMTVQFQNSGKKTLKGRAALEPQPVAGFKGGNFNFNLAGGGSAEWKLDVYPPEGFRNATLTGAIDFGKVRGRDLFVTLQGTDPADFKNDKLQKITAKAEAVASYAPSSSVEWWRSDPAVTQPPRGKKLTLAAAGQSKYRIVTAALPHNADGTDMTPDAWHKMEKPAPGERELALGVMDLQRCVQQMSGATLPVTSEAGAPSPAIRLVTSAVRPAGRIGDTGGTAGKWAYLDSYNIDTPGNGDVVISSGSIEGLRQGIYGLLTDHLDCHFFMPGKLGEEMPQPADRTVVVGEIHDRKDPSFFSVSGMSFGAARDWDQRTRAFINRGRMTFGHSWVGYMPPSEESYKANPDWWARDRAGKIRTTGGGTNFCSTSPYVIEKVAKQANGALSDPDTLVTSLDPNDYSPMCLCDRCLALDKSYGVMREDGTWVTDRLLHFSNEIHDRLDEKNKNKYLGILVYGFQIQLPNKALPHAHHAGMVCDMDWDYDHTRPINDPTSPQNRAFYTLLQGWGKILPQFGFYDYYGHYSNYGPWGIVHKMREDMPLFHDLNGTFIMMEAQSNYGLHGFNLYIASQLAWNVNADVDTLAEEFFTKFYGPAAGPMKQYWMAIEKRYALTRPGGGAIGRVAGDPQLYVELKPFLDAAEAAAKGADKRFAERVQFARDGLEIGRRHNEVRVKYGGRRGNFAANFDATQALADIKEHRAWYADVQKKYPENSEYYPPILRPLFFTWIEDQLKRVEDRAKQATTPG